MDSAARPEQPAHKGTGPLFHRRYEVAVRDAELGPEELMARVKSDLAGFSPKALADFEKAKGHRWKMSLGDEYDIRILGPWNGSVRVTEVNPADFTFATLKGHPEAGRIRFSADGDESSLRFRIESWARSRDGLVQLTYSGLKIGLLVQGNAWITFCKRVAQESGGRRAGRVRVTTETVGE